MEIDTHEELILAIDELAEHLRFWLEGGEFLGPICPLDDVLRRLDDLRDGVGIPLRLASHCRFRKGGDGYFLNGDWTDLESIKLSDFDRVKPYDWVHIEDIDEIARCQIFRGYKYFVVYPQTVSDKFFEEFEGVDARLFKSFPIGDYQFIDFMNVVNPSNPELHSECVCAVEQLDDDWSFFASEMYDEFCHSAFVYLNGWKMRVERFVGSSEKAYGRNAQTTFVTVPPMPNIQLSRKCDQLLRSIWERADWTKSPVRAKRVEVAKDVYGDEEKAESSTIRSLIKDLGDRCCENGVSLSLNNRGNWIEVEYNTK